MIPDPIRLYSAAMFRLAQRSRTAVVERTAVTGALAMVLALALSAAPAEAQGTGSSDNNRYRVGVTVGGTAFLSLTFEYQWNRTAVDVTVGTWSLRDLSVSVVGKQYVGGGDLKAFVGFGLWTVTAFAQERTGAALVLRAPIGVEWNFVDRHTAGLELNVNRALAVRRTDPEDDLPPNKRLVPLPGAYYRWASR